MASTLVAPKPADRPTSPGLISFGSDPSALDDYLNMDLFGAPPASRMSNSPASSHGALPVTPGTSADSATAVSPRPLFPALDASPGGSLAFVDSYTPLDKNFGAFPDLSMMPGSSMDLSMGQGLDQYNSLFQDMFANLADSGSSVSDNVFPAMPIAPQAAPAPAPVSSAAIDPQLFTAPAPVPAPPALSPLRAMTIDSDDDGSDGDSATNEDDDLAPLPTPVERTTRRPRKNAAAAGGIAKRPSRASTPSSVVPSYVHFDDPKPVIPPVLGKGGVASYLNGERIGSQEPDEWRPTPEEYKKLSSKEKRQLRNKISARNFRVRRKEYITTLESHIADRDQLISAIRSELSSTHTENTELRREIDALKRAIQEGRISAADTGLPPPRPLTPEGTPSAVTTNTRRKDLTRANTQKDRSADPSGRSFWGGAVGNGGVTSVHTTLIPDVFPTAEQLSGKPNPVRNLSPPNSSPPSSTGPATPPSEGVNMNPLMNLSPLFGPTKLPASPAGMNVGLDIMGDAFNQRTLDGFRAQLWGRMAKEAGARSVERERSRMGGVEQTGSDTVLSQSSPSQSSSSSSSSPSQPSSSSTPPLLTISSSPSLSMLNSPVSLRSLFDTQSQPSLFQASSFGPGFGASFPQTQVPAAPSTFNQAPAASATFNQTIAPSSTFQKQNAASAQARAMLQAQWLALQQARQNAAATPAPVHEVPAQVTQQPQASTSTSAQTREAQLASFTQAIAAQTKLNQQRQQQSQGPGGLAGSIRPAYLAAEKKEEKKGASAQQVASFATLVSQTLLTRMGSAFWDAFSGKAGAVDTDKVRRVLEGKAVVRVVDVEDEKKSLRRDVGLDGLEERMRSLAVGSSSMGSAADCVGCPKGLDMFSNLRGKK